MHEGQTSWYSSMASINRAILLASEKALSLLRQDLKNEGRLRIVAIDGAWATRGHSAYQFTFIVFDMDSKKIVYISTLTKKRIAKRGVMEVTTNPGNYEGSSNAMESQALHDWIKSDPDGFLDCVKIICSDGDTKIPLVLEELVHKHDKIHARDRGHFTRNFGKKVKNVIGDKFKQIYKRMQAFLATIIRRVLEEVHHDDLLQEHEMRCERFIYLWKYAFSHYTSYECDPRCPCQQSATSTHDENDSENEIDQDCVSESSNDNDDSDSDGYGPQEQDLGSDDDSEAEELQNHDDSAHRLGPVSRQAGPSMDDDDELLSEVSATRTTTIPPPSSTSTKSNGRQIVHSKHCCDAKCSKACSKAIVFDSMMQKLREIFNNVLNDISTCLWDADTTFVENSHSIRGKYVKKTKSYGPSFNARAHMSALIQNFGYLKTAELVWTELRNLPTFIDSVQDLTHLIRDTLHDLDAKRSRDSNRKKSLEFKKSQKSAAQRKSLDLRAAKKLPNKGQYQPDFGTVRRQASIARLQVCVGCNQSFAKLGPHQRWCKPFQQSISGYTAPSPSALKRGNPSTMDIDDADGTTSDGSAQEAPTTTSGTILVDGFMLVQGDDDEASEPPFIVDMPLSYQDEMKLAMVLSEQDAEQRKQDLAKESIILKTALSNEGLFLHDLPNSRTGDCYFIAIAYFYRLANSSLRIKEFAQDSSITPHALRKFIVGYMERNPEMTFTKHFEDEEYTQPLRDWFKPGEWKIYLESMAKPGTYADDMVIAAASNCLDLYQRVYWNDESETVKHETKNKRNLVECKIALTLVEKHYYAVTDKEEP